MDELARRAAVNANTRVIAPAEGEEQVLKDLLTPEKFKEMKDVADKITKKDVEALALKSLTFAIRQAGIVSEYTREVRSSDDLNSEDKLSLTNHFLNVFQSTCKVNGLVGDAVGAAVGAAGAVYVVGNAIHNHIREKRYKRIEEENRFKPKADKLERDLIAMTIDGRKSTFEKINTIWLAKYYATFNRKDVSYAGEDKKLKVISGYGERSYSSIPNFKEEFIWQGILAEKIDESRKTLKDRLSYYNFPFSELYNEEDILVSKCISEEDYSDYIEFVKNWDCLDLVREDKRKDFEIKYKVYRALKEFGEFFEIKNYGDRNALRRGLCSGLIPVAGWLYGAGFAIERTVNTIKWNENAIKLKEVMRSCIKICDKLDEIIQKKCLYKRLEFYNNWTKSEYGKDLLKKNEKELESEFANAEAKEKFDHAFDLYQKITNTGIADRENYIDFNFEFKSATAVKSLRLVPTTEM